MILVKRPDLSKNFAAFLKTGEADAFNKDYYAAHDNVTDCHFARSDIEEFIKKELPNFENDCRFEQRAGVYLSALINTYMKGRVRLDLSCLEKRIDAFGAYLNEEISLSVKANLGQATGYRIKGIMIVNGSVTDLLGCYLDGGTIVMNGTAGYFVGDGMISGVVNLRGEYGSLAHGCRIEGTKVTNELSSRSRYLLNSR